MKRGIREHENHFNKVFKHPLLPMNAMKRNMHSPQNKKRSHLLINGFLRHCQRTNNFNRFPSELVRLIFDLYYLIHGEWLSQNINIQIVNVNGDSDKDGYVSARLPLHPYGNDTFCVTHDPSFSSECETPIWRMYPKPECGGFILRPTKLYEVENVTKWTMFLGIPEDEWWKVSWCEAPNAVVLQLVQTKDCGNDEYYFQRIDNGQYLTFQWPMRFQDDQSKATLFRFKTFHQPLEQWKKQLTVNSHVLYRGVKGTVIATKHNGFGTEIKIRYWRDTVWYRDSESDMFRRVSCEKWIPIESDEISIQNELSAKDFGRHEFNRNWIDLDGEVGDDLDGLTSSDGRGQYKRRVKSKRKRRVKSEKKQGTKERRKWTHKKWSGKDNDKRIKRKSRKYGLIRKYHLCL